MSLWTDIRDTFIGAFKAPLSMAEAMLDWGVSVGGGKNIFDTTGKLVERNIALQPFVVAGGLVASQNIPLFSRMGELGEKIRTFQPTTRAENLEFIASTAGAAAVTAAAYTGGAIAAGSMAEGASGLTSLGATLGGVGAGAGAGYGLVTDPLGFLRGKIGEQAAALGFDLNKITDLFPNTGGPTAAPQVTVNQAGPGPGAGVPTVSVTQPASVPIVNQAIDYKPYLIAGAAALGVIMLIRSR